MRVDEIGVDRQRFSVLRYSVIKLPDLQIQFGKRVIWIRIVGNQLNVILERTFGVGLLHVLPVGITEQVEG